MSPISSVGTNNLLNNSGQINILNAQTFSSIAIQDTGTINVLSSGLLTYGLGTFTYTTGAVLTGGTINLGSSATHLLDGTLTLAAQDVALNGATITGGGNLQIAGRFDWNGGTIGGSGTATVLPGAQLNIQSGTVGSLSRTLNNAGTINISTGSIFFNNGTLNNLAGGVINITGSGTPLFSINAGTAMINNAGLMNVNPSLAQDQSTTLTSMIDSGTINAGSGTVTLSLGAYTYNTGAIFTGSAPIDLGSSNQNVNGTLTLAGSNMRIDGGSVTGSGNIVLTNTLSWNGGVFSGPGSMYVTPGGQLNIVGAVATLSRVLNNSGTVTISLSELQFSNGTLNNLAGGVINISGANTPFSGTSNGNLVDNIGLINVNPGAQAFINLSSIQMVNSGTITPLAGHFC